jgi:hypothetical protein
MRTYLLVGVIILLLAGLGVWAYVGLPKESALNPARLLPIPGAHSIGSSANATSTPLAPAINPQEKLGTLQLSYKDTLLAPIPDVRKEVAQGLCGLVFGGACSWEGTPISQKPFYINGTLDKEPVLHITYPTPRAVLQYGTNVPFSFSDPGPTGRYRVYLMHRNVIGEIDEVHEAHIVSESGSSSKTLMWDGNEVTQDTGGNVQTVKLPKGHYELTIANVDTGVEGGISSWVQTIDSATDVDSASGTFKPYAANTPLVNSYWDGRGVFMDGKEGEDTIDLTFKRSEVVAYRGVDMPDKNQYQVLVFYRRPDHAVVIITNVEIIKFADQTVRASDLIAELSK